MYIYIGIGICTGECSSVLFYARNHIFTVHNTGKERSMEHFLNGHTIAEAMEMLCADLPTEDAYDGSVYIPVDEVQIGRAHV